jgi:hypothetical protein
MPDRTGHPSSPRDRRQVGRSLPVDLLTTHWVQEAAADQLNQSRVPELVEPPIRHALLARLGVGESGR